MNVCVCVYIYVKNAYIIFEKGVEKDFCEAGILQGGKRARLLLNEVGEHFGCQQKHCAPVIDRVTQHVSKHTMQRPFHHCAYHKVHRLGY